MKKYVNIVWVVILLGALIMWWPFKSPIFFPFNWFNKNEETIIIENNQRQLDSLKIIIDGHKKHQLEMDKLLSRYGDSLLVLKGKIQERENKINELKKESNEIHNIVTKFNTSDINKFLSERYKDSLNTN